MNKFLILTAVLGVMLASVGGVIAVDDSQDLDGNLDGPSVLMIVVSPDLDFGAIPYSVNVNQPDADVTINTAGSEVATDKVEVAIDVQDTSQPTFYETLLQFDWDLTAGESWLDIDGVIIEDIAEGDARTYSSRLFGDATLGGTATAGAKTGVVVYTISEDMD